MIGNPDRPRLLSEKCSTCIFRPGNPMHLRPGRVRQMVRQALAGGGTITCHSTLSYGEYPDYGEAVCRGFYDNYGPQSNLVRIMERLGGFQEVPPPGSATAPAMAEAGAGAAGEAAGEASSAAPAESTSGPPLQSNTG